MIIWAHFNAAGLKDTLQIPKCSRVRQVSDGLICLRAKPWLKLINNHCPATGLCLNVD